jgi:hypothetical protein
MAMKSGKQRREEIKARRLVRLRSAQAPNPLMPIKTVPLGAVAVDPAQLAHNNTYGLLPSFYIDAPFVCRDCGTHEIWTAKQQKWWYEIAKGPIDSRAVRCRPCRLLERARVEEARRVSQAGMALKTEKKKNDENRNKNND